MLTWLVNIWHWLTDTYEYECPYCESEELCEECLALWAIK